MVVQILLEMWPMWFLFKNDINGLTFKDCISCFINYLIFTYVHCYFLTLDSNKYQPGTTDNRIEEAYIGEQMALIPQRDDEVVNTPMRYHFLSSYKNDKCSYPELVWCPSPVKRERRYYGYSLINIYSPPPPLSKDILIYPLHRASVVINYIKCLVQERFSCYGYKELHVG